MEQRFVNLICSLCFVHKKSSVNRHLKGTSKRQMGISRIIIIIIIIFIIIIIIIIMYQKFN